MTLTLTESAAGPGDSCTVAVSEFCTGFFVEDAFAGDVVEPLVPEAARDPVADADFVAEVFAEDFAAGFVDVVDLVLADFFGAAVAEDFAVLLAALFVLDVVDFCPAPRLVVDRRLAWALRIDSAGSEDFVSPASADACCCATSSARSPRGKKTSEGRPVSWLGISDPRPRPNPRRFSAIPDSSQ